MSGLSGGGGSFLLAMPEIALHSNLTSYGWTMHVRRLRQ